MENSNVSISWKTAHRRAKRTKLWVSGVYVTCMLYVVILNLEHAKVILGHSVHYSVNWPVPQKKKKKKRLIIERKGRKFGPRG